jgi:hypothetical protein
MARSRRPINPVVKLGVALVAAAGVAFLFWHSVRDSRAQPYRFLAGDIVICKVCIDV